MSREPPPPTASDASGSDRPHTPLLTRRAAIATGVTVLAGGAALGVRWCGAASPPVARGPGRRVARDLTLAAAPTEVEFGPGRRVTAWAYDGRLPGPEIRVREGERLRVTLRNRLTAPSSIHWHGLPQRGTNAMDGVPGVTQAPVPPGGTFVYDFVAEPAGTFFFHSHFGLQLEHGLYAPLIIEAAREPLAYDREYVLVLDDWPARAPERMLADLQAGRGPMNMRGMTAMTTPMAGMATGDASASHNGAAATDVPTPDRGPSTPVPDLAPSRPPAPGEAAPLMTDVPAAAATAGPREEEGADIDYQTFLINGRAPEAPVAFDVRRGERVRLRLINAGASTGFRVAVAGHRLRVTHADGQPVRPVDVDALELGVGERYDVVVAADNPGVWPLVAASVDEPARGARALLRYTDARGTAAPAPEAPLPRELQGRLLRYADLVAPDDGPFGPAPWRVRPDRVIDVPLRGQMAPYVWAIGDEPTPAPPFAVAEGETVLLRMRNQTLMRHPMHLHGHATRLRTGEGGRAVWKDTATVNPGGVVELQFAADNPGRWLFHCHHAYHQEAGMMRVLDYARR